MATIRRRDTRNFTGYGVKGENYVNNSIISVNLAIDDVGEDIGRCVKNGSIIQNPEYYDVTVRFISWRFYIRALNTNFPITNTFNSETAKRRYGRFKVSDGNYVVEEKFHSYEYEMSNIYNFVSIDIQGSPDEDIPCNEPPVTIGGDTIYAPDDSFSIFADSAGPSYFGTGLLYNSPNNVADYLQYFPEQGLESFNLGITFIYRCIGFDLSEWLSKGIPPRLRF